DVPDLTRRASINRRVVDERVQGLVERTKPRLQRLDRRAVPHVARLDPSSRRRRHRITHGGNHAPAFRHQHAGDFTSDAAAGSGDEYRVCQPFTAPFISANIVTRLVFIEPGSYNFCHSVPFSSRNNDASVFLSFTPPR